MPSILCCMSYIALPTVVFWGHFGGVFKAIEITVQGASKKCTKL